MTPFIFDQRGANDVINESLEMSPKEKYYKECSAFSSLKGRYICLIALLHFPIDYPLLMIKNLIDIVLSIRFAVGGILIMPICPSSITRLNNADHMVKSIKIALKGCRNIIFCPLSVTIEPIVLLFGTIFHPWIGMRAMNVSGAWDKINQV